MELEKTPISSLYELCGHLGLPSPVFRLVSQNGAEDAQFVCECIVDVLRETGKGLKKKDAKRDAAAAVLVQLQQRDKKVSGPRSRHSSGTSKLEADFKDVEFLGKGGYGAVFQARSKVDNHNYAVKCVFWPSTSLDQKQMECERIIREVNLLASLDNPHVIRYHNAWFEDLSVDDQRAFYQRVFPAGYNDEIELLLGIESSSPSQSSSTGNEEQSATSDEQSNEFSFASVRHKSLAPKELSTATFLFIKLQLCSGDLASWLEDDNQRIIKKRSTSSEIFGLRDRQEVLRVLEHLAKALRYLHGKSLMHRDLKPSNVLFASDRRVVLADFGCVKRTVEKLSIVNYDSTSATTSTSTSDQHTEEVGTKTYCAPEMCKHNTYDEKVDLFALGVIYFELLHPFNTQQERYRLIDAAKSLRFPEQFCNQDDRKVLDSLLSSDPSERLSAVALLDANPLRQYRVQKAFGKLSVSANELQTAAIKN